MSPILVTAGSFLITAALMPLIISLSLRKGFVDRPGELKVHKNPVPVFGGIGIFLGVLLPIAAVGLLLLDIERVLGALMVAAPLVALGVWDDLKNVSPRIRLAGQFLIALATLGLGLRVETVPLPAIAVPLTILLVVGAINTVNLFDGLDGLAGGTVCVSLVGFATVLWSRGDVAFTLLALAVLGAVLAFLFYNFNPARIFLGDNGSTFLGYVLAVLATRVASRPHDFRSLAVALLLIGLPIVDTSVAIARRAVRRRPIFLGDRSHIYDQLVDHGASVKQTALVCYAMQAVLVIIALAVRAAGS